LGTWSGYRALGLNRVSLGVWSADARSRLSENSAWPDQDLRDLVANLKSAGVGTSILTLVGAPGATSADSHIERTAPFIASLDLQAGDFVFLLDEREIDGSLWSARRSPALTAEEWLVQQAQLKHALAPLKQRGIKVLPYTMAKQLM